MNILKLLFVVTFINILTGQSSYACDGLKINLTTNDGIILTDVTLVPKNGLTPIAFSKIGNRFSHCLMANQTTNIITNWRLEISGSQNYFQVYNLEILRPVKDLQEISYKPPNEITLQVFNPALNPGFGSEALRIHRYRNNNSTARWENYYFCKAAYNRSKLASHAATQFHAGMCWYYASKQITIQSGGIVKIDPELISEFEDEFITNIVDKNGDNSALRRAYYKADKRLQIRPTDIMEDLIALDMRSWTYYKYAAAFNSVETKKQYCDLLKHFESKRILLDQTNNLSRLRIFNQKFKNSYQANKAKYFNYAEDVLELNMSNENCGLT